MWYVSKKPKDYIVGLEETGRQSNDYLVLIFYLLQLVPCVVLAVLIHPSTSHNILNRISWALCVYLEAVSVLPQLRVMQNTKVANFVL